MSGEIENVQSVAENGRKMSDIPAANLCPDLTIGVLSAVRLAGSVYLHCIDAHAENRIGSYQKCLLFRVTWPEKYGSGGRLFLLLLFMHARSRGHSFLIYRFW